MECPSLLCVRLSSRLGYMELNGSSEVPASISIRLRLARHIMLRAERWTRHLQMIPNGLASMQPPSILVPLKQGTRTGEQLCGVQLVPFNSAF